MITDVRTAYATAIKAAESGAVALRAVWPASVREMDRDQAQGIRDAMRCMEDGWATLLQIGDPAEEV